MQTEIAKVGANHSDDQKPEKLRIKVFDTQADYIRALPIHESQVEVETTDEWCVFEYRVVPCYNLYQKLLWYREKIEVLEPAYIRDEMKKVLQCHVGVRTLRDSHRLSFPQCEINNRKPHNQSG